MGEVNNNERFELMAYLYDKRYHQLPPGKLESPELPVRLGYEQNALQWKEWLDSGQAYKDLQDFAFKLWESSNA